METLIVHPDNEEQLNALKAFMRSLKIKFTKNELVKPSTSNETKLQKLSSILDKGADVTNFGNPSRWQKKVRQDRPFDE